MQGGALHALDFETVDELKLADLCVRETLRLNPPLVTVMRQVLQSDQRQPAETRQPSTMAASAS